MLLVVVVVLVVSSVNGQDYGPRRDYRVNPYYDEAPKPYSFSYSAPSESGVGQSSRTESADGSGRVQGSYSVNNDEGHFRTVDYVADQDGFRAFIRTNEPGTESKNPADVVIESNAVPGPYAGYADRYPYSQGIRRPILNSVVNPVLPIIAPVGPADVQPDIQVLPPAPVGRPTYYRPGYQSYRGNRYQNVRNVVGK